MRNVYEARNDRSTLQEACISVAVCEHYEIFSDNSELTDHRLTNEKIAYVHEPYYETTELSVNHGRALLYRVVINLNYSAHILLLYEYSVQIDRFFAKSKSME